MEVQFVASVAPIVRDADAARLFYRDALGLSFEGEEGDYVFTQNLEGTKHFGLWPLSEAASACFGTTEWPADIPVPQGTPVYAVTAGTIIAITPISSDCGNGIVLAGRDGYQYVYCHGSQLFVTTGQQVSVGQTIMLSGTTGNSSH